MSMSSRGKPVQVGDEVAIRCRVISVGIGGSGDICTLRPIEDRGPAEVPETSFSCATRLVTHAATTEEAIQQPKAEEPQEPKAPEPKAPEPRAEQAQEPTEGDQHRSDRHEPDGPGIVPDPGPQAGPGVHRQGDKEEG